ncbi:DUF4349 domain-containing protein [Nonomuraea sp. NPDC050328]|uniref:DUF4349 domain-containing protein n=1 Tax=Nonomuraea sp. NPDC050328 TaxID=3364361 RepID=UPI00379CD85C
MSRLRSTQLALTGVCAALTLAACGGGGTSFGGASSEAGAPAMATAPPAAPEEQAKAPRGESITTDVKGTQQERKIIYVARITIRAKDVAAASAKSKTIVTAAGGYLSKEDSSSADQNEGRATLEFKIPPERYQEVLTAFGKDLGQQLSLNQNTEDVTLQVADVDSRLKSAEEALASLRTLLGQAKTIGQVLEVEREIRNRESELESLQAQQKELARQTGMATVTLQLIGPVVPAPEPEEDPAGFLEGLRDGWDALVTFLKIVVTVLGVVLPWLLVIVPVFVLVSWLVRRRRPGYPAPPAPPATAPAPAPEEPGGPPAVQEKEPV